MGLVLRLEEEIYSKRKAILEKIAAELKDKGIKTSFSREPEADFSGGEKEEVVLQLQDFPVHKIRLRAYSYGTTTTLFRFQYDLALDKEMPAGMAKSLKAVLKPVREKGLKGLFGGEFTDVRWDGNGLAEALNADSELTGRLAALVKEAGDPDIQVYVKSPSEIELLGPKFAAPFHILSNDTSGVQFVEKAVRISEFGVFQRIAEHVRKAL